MIDNNIFYAPIFLHMTKRAMHAYIMWGESYLFRSFEDATVEHICRSFSGNVRTENSK